MTVEEWKGQGFIFTEALRGGPLVWPSGGSHLDGDPLGPVRHAHRGAAEYLYLMKGRAHVEVGGEARIVEEGDLVYIPPDAPHNFYDPVEGDEVWLFALVAPNRVNEKWHLTGFSPESEQLRMTITRFAPGDAPKPVPGELSATWLRVDEPTPIMHPDHESLYLVVDGSAEAQVGRLAGTVSAGDYLHARAGVPHEVGGRGSRADMIRFDCPLVQWAGVELAG